MEIEAIVCDMDGCLVSYPNEPYHSTWGALAKAVVDKEEWVRIKDFYTPKRELYAEWFKEQVKLLKGMKVEDVTKYLFPIPYSLGVKEFFQKRDKYIRGIISAGINLVADKIVEELGFDFAISNFIEVKNTIITGKGQAILTGEGRVIKDIWRKDFELIRVAEERGFSLDRTLYVGDYDNDIPIFDIVGVSVAFRPKSLETRKAADYVINDFRELEKILEI